MANSEILVPPNNIVLNQIAKKISVKDIRGTETQNLIDLLFHVARDNQGDKTKPTLVGLAAPQIGHSKRIVIIGVGAAGNGETPNLRVFINPKIVQRSEGLVTSREGCFSTGKVCGIVERHKSVVVSAYDRKGKKFDMKLEGFPARVAQHEIDHLNGIRFPDRISDDKNLHWVEKAEFGRYRTEWESWPTICPRQRWEDIKTGQ